MINKIKLFLSQIEQNHNSSDVKGTSGSNGNGKNAPHIKSANSRVIDFSKYSRFYEFAFILLALIALQFFLADTAMAVNEAAKFNIKGGIKAATAPIMEAIKSYWSTGVVISGGATALLGEGDMRQRAIRAGMGAGAAGLVVLGLLAMLS